MSKEILDLAEKKLGAARLHPLAVQTLLIW
jgi:hypothetical protein